VLEWAEEAAQFSKVVMIVPKVTGIIARLPRTIGGADVRLGYSVPTKHGGTFVPAWEFSGWPVHLLGGSPHKQRELSAYFDTVSIDGNMFQKMAVRYCSFYVVNSRRYKRGHWPSLLEADGKKWGEGAPYEAFRRSCANIIAMWR